MEENNESIKECKRTYLENWFKINNDCTYTVMNSDMDTSGHGKSIKSILIKEYSKFQENIEDYPLLRYEFLDEPIFDDSIIIAFQMGFPIVTFKHIRIKFVKAGEK